MLLHEARDAWDPAHWSIRIFDFLLSRARDQARTAHSENGKSAAHNADFDIIDALGESLAVSSQDDFSVDSFGFADMSDLSVPGTFDDSLLMPNFYIPSARAFYTFGQYQFDLAIDSSQ
jgi:hypothetical protein